MKQDLTTKSNATAFDIIYRENSQAYLLTNNYTVFAERMAESYKMTAQQWEYLLKEWEKKERILTDKTDYMKRLYLNNGSSVDVTLFEDEFQRTINVYEDDFINLKISKGRAAIDQYIILGDTTQSFKIWDAELALEIYKSFEQHWNYLKN